MRFCMWSLKHDSLQFQSSSVNFVSFQFLYIYLNVAFNYSQKNPFKLNFRRICHLSKVNIRYLWFWGLLRSHSYLFLLFHLQCLLYNFALGSSKMLHITKLYTCIIIDSICTQPCRIRSSIRISNCKPGMLGKYYSPLQSALEQETHKFFPHFESPFLFPSHMWFETSTLS